MNKELENVFVSLCDFFGKENDEISLVFTRMGRRLLRWNGAYKLNIQKLNGTFPPPTVPSKLINSFETLRHMGYSQQVNEILEIYNKSPISAMGVIDYILNFWTELELKGSLNDQSQRKEITNDQKSKQSSHRWYQSVALEASRRWPSDAIISWCSGNISHR